MVPTLLPLPTYSPLSLMAQIKLYPAPNKKLEQPSCVVPLSVSCSGTHHPQLVKTLSALPWRAADPKNSRLARLKTHRKMRSTIENIHFLLLRGALFAQYIWHGCSFFCGTLAPEPNKAAALLAYPFRAFFSLFRLLSFVYTNVLGAGIINEILYTCTHLYAHGQIIVNSNLDIQARRRQEPSTNMHKFSF